ncbi:ATP-dependent nuclease, subunit A [Enhygromyxa salina]|uniref:DNA 3'-5' helicase n=1 Tax=Enhygromyxa salina TaxID=215803 RepID=A0A0C2D3U0_9BACT|nr:UvrD-helicase domain-containing protein [Enhygromyxa salina]KIG16395.1 ATP-dependent nuclease, subunit A [Enhygromyxa salina]
MNELEHDDPRGPGGSNDANDHASEQGSLELDANLVLAAGAGAGKTHALVTVALGLYVGAGQSQREPLDPAQVWAVTFTEKAARELRQRIVARAGALADNPEAALAEEPELAQMLGDRQLGAPRWRAILDQLPAAPIGTFHSLCGQLLRSFAVEAGVDPSFGVLDENAANELFARTLDEVLLRELEGGDDGDDDSHTRAAARALGGPDTLRAALRRLHGKLGEEGRDPQSLLTDAEGQPQPGFDRKLAWASFADACQALCDSIALLEESREDRLRPTLRALAIERRRIGDCEPRQVDRWYPAMVRVAGQRRGKGTLPKRAKRVWEPFAAAWEQVQDCVASLEEQELARRIVALLDAISRAYAAEKQRLQVLDFVDLVRGAHDLLRDDRVVRRQVKQRLGALLVDEFQDTNGLQLDLVHLLAEARDHERAVPRGARASALLPLGARCFAAVGDRKQSIYEFRGADVSLFQTLAARARSGGAGLRLHALRRSWRSRPRLVEFCNQLFARLLISDDPEGFAVDWIEDVDRLTPVREDHEDQAGIPAVQLLCSDPTEDARARRSQEARRMAEHLRLLLDARPPLGRSDAQGRPKPLRGADVAILMRTHSHVARYRKALSELGIASVVVGGRGFYAAREVRELAVLMLAIADPRDPLASAGVWRSPVWGICDASIVELAVAEQLRVADHVAGCAIELSAPEDAATVTQVARLIDRLHHELDRLGPARVLRFAVDRLGLRQVLAWDDAGEQRIANVDKLIALLGSREFAGLGAVATARRLLERGEDLLDREAPAEVAAAADPDAVRIMTVHAAKGLEFPVVIVPELGAEPRGQEGPVVFERELGLAVVSPDLVGRRRPSPHAQAINERLAARRDAESRRLLYVACTRARDLLVLIGDAPEGRGAEGNWRKLIDAALPELTELVEVVDAGPVIQTEQDGPTSAIQWLLERVDAVRRAATDAPAPADASPTAAPLADPTDTPSPTPPTPPDPARQATDESPEQLDRAYARSEALHLRDCELEVSLSGLAEFDKCPRRYLLTHVVGLETPVHEEREAMVGLQLLPFVPRERGNEHDSGDRSPPSLSEARARGRLVHYLLGSVDLDRLGRDPARALDGFAAQDHIPDRLWSELRDDLLRFAARPWVHELIEIQRSDPRRVLRSLPFALQVLGEHAPQAPPVEPTTRPQLDLFAPITTAAAPPPEGCVIVRGRIDLVWIDDDGRLNVVDWQYGRAPPDPGSILDPDQVAGFRRLTQAWALRRLWGDAIALRAGAVFLREQQPDPGLRELDAATLARFDQRLRGTAARLLRVELGEDATAQPWPKLEQPAACGECIHIARCWRADPADSGGPEADNHDPGDR